jgi:hypothetical protein
MQDTPELMGRLTIRLFVVAGAPDQYGRMNGAWKTLASHYLHRDDIPGVLANFTRANPAMQHAEGNIDVSFVTREHFPL